LFTSVGTRECPVIGYRNLGTRQLLYQREPGVDGGGFEFLNLLARAERLAIVNRLITRSAVDAT